VARLRAAPSQPFPRTAPAVGLVVTAVTTLQLGAGFAATLFDDLGPAGTAFGRQSIAAIVLVALWRPRLRPHGRRELALAVAFGATLGVMNWMIYTAIDRIPLGIAVTLEFLGPLGVAVAGSRRALDAVWVVLAGGGVLLLADPGGSSGGLATGGVAAALAAGALWAAYIHLSARTGRAFPGMTGLALAMPVAALVTAPAGIAQAGDALLRPGLLASAAVVALASSVIPYSLELEALRRLPARVFGVLMSLEPAVAALSGLIVLGQGLAAREVVAIGLVVVASAGAASQARPSSHSRIDT
jgi:inner membrane transporter RhtA